jgi:GT2 family glycosyltransferase
LAALAAADPPPAEVVVVDQDPRPETREAVAQLRDIPHRYLVQARLGLSASRNAALAATATPVLAVTDDDCVPEPGWIGALARALDSAPRPAAVTGAILTLGPRPHGMHAISLREPAHAADHRGREIPWTVGSGANFAASVAVLEAAGGWDERLGAGTPGRSAEDADLIDRLLRGGATVRSTPDAVIRHDWQTWERRLATRWSYGYGVGVLAGFMARSGDVFALRILWSYLRPNLLALAGAAKRGERPAMAEYLRATASPWPGILRGLRTGPQRGR